jgi:hypothetical protein
VLLRRLCQDDAAAIAEAVLASIDHLEPWMPWATPAAADTAHQRSRIAGADGLWDAGTDFVYSVLPGVAITADEGRVTGVPMAARQAGPSPSSARSGCTGGSGWAASRWATGSTPTMRGAGTGPPPHAR